MRFIALLLIVSPVWAQQTSTTDDARYNAVLWTQNAPEYAVAVRQTYRMARLQLAAGLANKDTSADEEQLAAADFADKPPAIILDVDETVLDNSPYNARNIQDRESFRPATWTPWVNEAAAPAVPGAIEFIQHAQKQGVTVFLVTNRKDEHRDGTLKNLARVGLMVPEDHLLLRNDDAGRGGDKISRRAMVAKDFRIVLLIGDNIADLCSGVGGEPADVARSLAFEKQNKFADGWVMIPNAMYGGWERNGDGLRTQRPTRVQQSSTVIEPLPATPAIGTVVVTPAPLVQPNATQVQPAPPAIGLPMPTIVPQCPCNCPRCRRMNSRRFNSRR